MRRSAESAARPSLCSERALRGGAPWQDVGPERPEARRLGLRHGWLFVVLTAGVAFACAFPLFRFVRDRRMRAAKEIRPGPPEAAGSAAPGRMGPRPDPPREREGGSEGPPAGAAYRP